MTDETYDLFVIGAGSGGVRAARVAASLGARVGIAEERHLGGTCVNVGCIPKKLLVYAASYGVGAARAGAFGWGAARASLDWPKLRDGVSAEVRRLVGVYGRLLEGSGVEIVAGHAKLLDSGLVQVGNRRISAKRILLATGGMPWLPNVPGHELALVSDDMFALPALPASIAVVGGGYIALEFASLLHAFGVRVTLVYRGLLFLRGFDSELRLALADALRARGLDIRFEANVVSLSRRSEGNALRLEMEDGSALDVDAALYATGRVPRLTGMGIEDLPIERDSRGQVKVDENFCSSLPGVYAIGDVVGRAALTPVAIREGEMLARGLFAQEVPKLDYARVPTAVFTLPEMASVGLSEEDASARLENGQARVWSSSFTPLKHSLQKDAEKNLLKLIVAAEDDRVIGAHMLGEGAAEIVQCLAVAMQSGATKAQFDETLSLHPTTAEEFVTLRASRPLR